MIRSVIIEDEKNSQELLKIMLEEYCEGIEICGFASHVKSGIELIEKVDPQVVFLDIQINGGEGFDILDAFESPTFKVIFITGYDHYAIKAIKYAALDYILKPIDLSELKNAIQKIDITNENYEINFDFLKNNINAPQSDLDQILIPGIKGYNLIKFNNINYLQAQGSYVSIDLKDNKNLIASNSLKYYEELLPSNIFYKTHKSYLININKVSHIEPGRGGAVLLENDVKIPISYRRKTQFLSFLKSINKI